MHHRKLIAGALAVCAIAAVAQIAGVTSSPTDTSPPAAVTAAPTTATNADGSISVSWKPSSDAQSGIKAYNIRRDGNYIATVNTTSYNDTTAAMGKHGYEIIAVNGAGLRADNRSPIGLALTYGAGSGKTLKPVVGGVLDRKGVPADDLGGIVDAFVVDVNWSQLQPTKDGGLVDNSPIDAALAAARTKGYQVKLRVDVGGGAPVWAKNLAGGSFQQKNDDSGTGAIEIGRWWTPQYVAAYDRLQQLLATKYDAMNVPLYDVAISGCTTAYSEPMIKGFGGTTKDFNLTQLASVGYKSDYDVACMRRAIDTHERYWKHTRSSFAFNPYQSMVYKTDGTYGMSVDLPITYDIMTYCRATLGTRCVLGNNSLQPDKFGGSYGQMYDRMKSMGGAMYFQTASSAKLADAEVWPTIDDYATVREGASYVELNTKYPWYDRDHLRSVDSTMLAKAYSLS